MNAQELRDQVIRSEGYAEGFRAGYAACAKYVAQEESKAKDSKGNPEKSDSKY